MHSDSRGPANGASLVPEAATAQAAPRPCGLWNPDVPNQARMYDYYLGGKDNYAVDREAAENVLQHAPGVTRLARENRDFLTRAVAKVATLGVRQFIDFGSGLPGPNPIHEVVRRFHPDAKVVYSDLDQIAIVHGENLLPEANTLMLKADLREPATLIERHAGSRIHRLIDWQQPVCVTLVAVLHFLSDTDDPLGVLAWLRTRLPRNSYLVISHVTPGDLDPASLDAACSPYKASGGVYPRTSQQVADLCQGLELLRPGLVPLHAWNPDIADALALPQLTDPDRHSPQSPRPTVGGVGAVGKLIWPVDLRPRDLDRPRRQAV